MSPGRRRIGLYGGSFNPVHFGHLRAAEEVREGARLDEVWLVPASAPPHKQARAIAPAADRLRMLELALDEGHAGASSRRRGLRVEPIELERPGPSYTYDTVRSLRARHPKVDLVLILGIDSFRELHTWHEHDRLLAECDLIVTSRPPDRVAENGPGALAAAGPAIAVAGQFCYQESEKCFFHRSGRRLDFLAVTALDISASRIRALIESERSIRFLTPNAVVEYIAAQSLYQVPRSARGKQHTS